MADRKKFEKKETIYFVLVLVVSLLSLVISVSTLFIHEYRYISLTKRIDNLGKKSQAHEESLKVKHIGKYMNCGSILLR